MMMNNTPLTQLGHKVAPAEHPDLAALECMPHKNDDLGDMLVRLTCPEFTSLCPVTGQPDFAIIIVDYIPDVHLVESKSFKLLMQSFRSIGMTHEQIVQMIGVKIYKAAEPSWIQVSGYFNPRGGIPIDVFWEAGETEIMINSPPHNIATYSGRGG